MYPKGANMLHMIRQIINDDAKWKSILRGLNSTFYHQTVTSKQIEDYVNTQSGINFNRVFAQYLTTTQIPVFEYMFKNGTLGYHWTNCVAKFDMPVKVKINGVDTWLKPTTDWQSEKTTNEDRKVEVDKNFYVTTSNIIE